MRSSGRLLKQRPYSPAPIILTTTKISHPSTTPGKQAAILPDPHMFIHNIQHGNNLVICACSVKEVEKSSEYSQSLGLGEGGVRFHIFLPVGTWGRG